jgi:hypothetical protein
MVCWACNLTAFNTVPLVQWSTHLLPVMRDLGSIPRGVLVWNRDSPVSVVSLHWWPQCDWSLWPHLRRASSRTVTRPSCQRCENPTWSPIAFLSRFHARCRSSFWLHSRHSRLLVGKPCVEPVISLHSTSSTGPMVYPFASCHEGPGFNPQGGTVSPSAVIVYLENIGFVYPAMSMMVIGPLLLY